MPSPFPGMDPYLEEPGLWPDVHHELISETRALLNTILRPKYYVRIEQRVYISDEGDSGRLVMVPDLRIALNPDREGQAFVPGGGTALAVAEPIEAITLIEEEIHESYIEIVDRVERLVVTVIEILSPTNKVAGSRGRESYETKRSDVMRSPSHLVEIDLLRRGLPIPVYGGNSAPRIPGSCLAGGSPTQGHALADPAVSEAASDHGPAQAGRWGRRPGSSGRSRRGL